MTQDISSYVEQAIHDVQQAANNTSAVSTASNQEQTREEAILDAAITYFGTLGFYGTSLQKIATHVGLTKAGVLHYVGSKEGLLTLALSGTYDKQTDAINSKYEAMQHPHLPAMLREIVAVNAVRPKLVHMFSTLSAEAINPDHPAHDYFLQREKNGIAALRAVAWDVPEGIDIAEVCSAAYCAMDGMQLRWLRNPEYDLNTMWSSIENALFPEPLWSNYR